MEYITVILMICGAPKYTDKAACEAKFKACVQELSEKPVSKENDLTKFDLAVHLLDAKNQKLLCN